MFSKGSDSGEEGGKGARSLIKVFVLFCFYLSLAFFRSLGSTHLICFDGR